MMNAKELAECFGQPGLLAHLVAERDTILRALSLLAAAEANDGTTPETDGAAGTVHNDFGDPIEVTPADFARRFERERNGLAAEVLRLQALHKRFIAALSE